MEDETPARAGAIGSAPVCATCGSGRVVTDAWACWNPSSGLWELEASFDQAYCQVCEAETTLRWVQMDLLFNKRVQELNDAFRQEAHGTGSMLVTRGIADQGEDLMHRAIAAVQAFDTFAEDNDHYGEHDFGAIEIDGQKIFWKIDFYEDRSVKEADGSPVVSRVLTIMLASEY